MREVEKYPQARLFPGALVTIALLFAIKGGGKLGLLLNQWGPVVKWDCATGNIYDVYFHPLIEAVKEHLIMLTGGGFQAASRDPENMKVCARGTWNVRLAETVRLMLTRVYHFNRLAIGVDLFPSAIGLHDGGFQSAGNLERVGI